MACKLATARSESKSRDSEHEASINQEILSEIVAAAGMCEHLRNSANNKGRDVFWAFLLVRTPRTKLFDCPRREIRFRKFGLAGLVLFFRVSESVIMFF